MVVYVDNGVASCSFSSKSGGSLIVGHSHFYYSERYIKCCIAFNPTERGLLHKSNPKGSKTGLGKQEVLMTDVEHETLRSGIQSLMLQMDDMIAGIKKSK